MGITFKLGKIERRQVPPDPRVDTRFRGRLDDGWAHTENMETLLGSLRELWGMLHDDRHERLMREFELRMLENSLRRLPA